MLLFRDMIRQFLCLRHQTWDKNLLIMSWRPITKQNKPSCRLQEVGDAPSVTITENQHSVNVLVQQWVVWDIESYLKGKLFYQYISRSFASHSGPNCIFCEWHLNVLLCLGGEIGTDTMWVGKKSTSGYFFFFFRLHFRQVAFLLKGEEVQEFSNVNFFFCRGKKQQARSNWKS